MTNVYKNDIEDKQNEYNLERLSPKQRQAIWEQEHLNELQGYPSQQLQSMPITDLEQYTIFKEEQLTTDEFEQTMNINEMEKWEEAVQHYRNAEQLIQNEQWEQIVFLYQQLQQPIHHSP